MNVSSIESERLILRGFNVTDAEDVQRLAGTFEVADTTLNIPHPYEDGLAERWIAGQEAMFSNGKGVAFAIVLKSDMSLVGAISLMGIEEGHQAEVGYWIGLPYWGKGICTEAGKLVIDYAFNVLKLNRLYAHHLSRNPASGRVLIKLGFAHEGLQKGHVRKWGKSEDVTNYGLMRPASTAKELEERLVVLNVIQAEECDADGKAFPHVIARLFEDGAMTLFAMLEMSSKETDIASPGIVSLVLENQKACLASHSVAVYCRVRQVQAQMPGLDLRLVYWPSGEPIATAKLDLAVRAGSVSCTPVEGEVKALDVDSPYPNVVLMRRFTGRHRGQAGHVNIQHFAQTADDACRNVASLLGCPPADKLVLLREKIRFKAEMHPGDCAFVQCTAEQTGSDQWLISGEIVRMHDEAIVCLFQRVLSLATDQAAVRLAQQNYLADKLEIKLNDIPLAETIWGPLETYRGTVEPLEVGANSMLSTRALFDKMTRALWSVQNALGANRDVMIENKLAGGASIFQLQYHQEVKLGTPVVIRSSVRGRSDSSLRMQHEVCDARDSRVLIDASYVLTFFDRQTGKRAAIPSFIAGEIDES